MTDVLLGIIALAAVTMAVAQVVHAIVVTQVARRLEAVAARVETELGPIADRLKAASEHARQASALAAVQVERLDQLLSSVSRRAEETVGLLQQSVVGPLREGMAVFAAIRGVVAAFRSFRGGEAPDDRASSRFDEEDPLFIG